MANKAFDLTLPSDEEDEEIIFLGSQKSSSSKRKQSSGIQGLLEAGSKPGSDADVQFIRTRTTTSKSEECQEK
jgi:hypothetical protein